MKFSESWLREWVNPANTSEQLTHQITMAGLEVDGIDAVAGEFSNVVVGEVIECGQHPDADKLQVTKVNVGDEVVDIVCGAKNCRLGLKVAVAKVGAVLPGNFKIKKAKLRGQPSHGMLCSESELGMAESADGILELPNDAPIGTDVRDYLKLDDVTIDVDLTSNRGDCLGIRGLAREVGVLNNQSVNEVSCEAHTPTIDDALPIEITAGEACPRYLGRVIKGIDVNATTPLWMVEKLRRCGVRAIDPVVDVTNYVLLELGHPMHAFDLAKIDGGINVRFAKANEPLTLLDGQEVKLNEQTLVIADHSKPLAMAGIFGGQDSGVSGATQDILLESAFFAPLAILGKARQYGLHTDASHRYERGVDPQLQFAAMERATALLVEIVGGQAGPIVEAKSEQHLPKANEVTLRRVKLDSRIGIHIETEQVTEILTRLGFAVDYNNEQWLVTVPPYRFDIKIEEDLTEEVARVYGYNNIPNVAPEAKLTMRQHQEATLTIGKFKDVLVNRGYQEAITYSFVDPKIQEQLFPAQEVLTLPHPISSEMSVMRVSLWPGLLQSVVYNQNRQQSRVRLFESGLSFIPDAEAENGVRQEPMFAGVITGLRSGEHWQLEKSGVDFFDAKGDVEALLALTANSQAYEFRVAEHSALHPGQTAAIYRGEEFVGYVGTVHPELERKLGLNGRTVVFELRQSEILRQAIPLAQEISKFPGNRRDIAVIVKDEISANSVLQLIEKVGTNHLVSLELFDVYQGKGIEPGYKSLAIALTLQDKERTLEEKDINNVVQIVVQALTTELDASLRD
ncbi:phenylalanine--tRNA ligase subunit beta [Thalassotalea litorea]|uniref:Phenylalanine--tRNA ligase beta subunit n=1 Tax=Thalassotalea litorea TaxID=2020715 RepID=A0A5R9IXF2_9GAMM|nr:phenylalanine--tRNA ligase subunit beta [Thalassotalea litorea]TLU68041.1 phenylalanine--tRNA ligase subunit beta [Thalassotalea litorea]